MESRFDILVEERPCGAVAEQSIELVERKGTGHPDTICDCVCDRVSTALCQAYLRAAGRVLHHNVDKALLVAGQTELRFGGGRVVEPMRLIVSGRASPGPHGEVMDRVAARAARGWIRGHLPQVDVGRCLLLEIALRRGAPELGAIFAQDKDVLDANDTSVGVGFAPLTPTESLVLGLERHLNSASFKEVFPDTGQDVKVMALRRGKDVSFTVAMPLLAMHVRSERSYFRRKDRVLAAIRRFLGANAGELTATVDLNALDQPGRGVEGTYLSLLGTSAEHGDDGQVGRGNRVSGLISFHRPMSLEAAAGKNPVSHVGKIYNVLATRIAERIYRRLGTVREATVWLCSRIGQPIDRPQIVSVQLACDDIGRKEDAVRRVVASELERLPKLCGELARGRWSVV